MSEWYLGDEFWQELSSYLFPPERFAQAEEEVEQIIALTKPRGDHVLDLACGPGRHSVALAKYGYRVTGVDQSAFLLEKAKDEARLAGVDITWILDDMRHFREQDAFDLVINMYTSFGYFERADDDRQVLQNIFESLRVGGKVLLEMMGKERLAAIFLPSNVEVIDEDCLLVQRREIINDWTRTRQEWILIRNGKARSFALEHTIYSGRELRDRLLASGFAEVLLYGSLDGTPYDRDAQRLVAVARK
jgi:SAM-dependent methyltransferase